MRDKIIGFLGLDIMINEKCFKCIKQLINYFLANICSLLTSEWLLYSKGGKVK